MKSSYEKQASELDASASDRNGDEYEQCSSDSANCRDNIDDIEDDEEDEDEKPVFEPWTGDTPSLQQVDEAMGILREKRAEWASLPLGEKIELLKEIRQRLMDNPVTWAHVSAELKGCDSVESFVAGELMANTMLVANTVDGLSYTLKHILKKNRCPQLAIQSLLSGQQKIQVFPLGFWENHLNFYAMQGLQIELYLQPGKSAALCTAYTTQEAGKLCVILGAGNQGYVSLGDVLFYMFNKGCTVLLKYHPMQALYATYAEHLLEPLRTRGYYWSMVCEDIEVVEHAVYHPMTDVVHLTGTKATHDVLAWGEDPRDAAERKQKNQPLLKVPIYSQLECVTPYIIVPGPWNEEETEHHVRQLVAAFTENNSCNTMTPRVVFVAGDWDVTDTIIAKFKEALSEFPSLPAVYPGCKSRYNAFKRHYPNAEVVPSDELPGAEQFGPVLPWLVNVLEAFPEKPEAEYAFRVDPFCPCITFAKLWASDDDEETNFEENFLEDAVAKANQCLYGTQSVSVVVHHQTEDMYKQGIEAAVQKLRYGVVCLNAWSNVAYFPQVTVWGAFAEDQDITTLTSGLGHIRNSFMYDNIQKAIVRTPFISSMHPQPFTTKKVSVAAARAAVGLNTNGFLGMYKMFTHSR